MSKPSKEKTHRSIGGQGGAGAGKVAPGETIDEFDLASEFKGKNSMQADDAQAVRSERQAQPDAQGETDDVVESFEKMDKDVRAERDLGKNARKDKS